MQKCISSCYTLNYTILQTLYFKYCREKGQRIIHCSEIQISLALYNRIVNIVFLFLYKAREKHISSCYTLNIAAK